MTIDDVMGRQNAANVRISCPFPGHDDANPSAIYYTDGHVHCFGCGGHARSLADLVRQREFANLPEGIGLSMAKTYMQKYMKDLPAIVPAVSVASKPADDPGPDNLTLVAMSEFCDAARANLDTNPRELDRIARERGLKAPTALGIGLADMTLVRITRKRLIELGFGEDAIETALHRAGILGKNDLDETIYRLSNRIIIPEWRSNPRHVVYYQGRANNPRAKQKYLNPPIRNKPIFGYDSLKRDTERVWIGEGPFDVLPLLEIGESAVASMGAHMTERQMAMLATAAGDREVIVFFDNDHAGRIGAERIVENLRVLGTTAHAAFPREGYHDLGEWAANEPIGGIIGEVLWDIPA